jgi:filamentous hemagglutinin family protein
MSTTTVLGSQWLYKFIKHSSSILFGLVLANATPLFPAQVAVAQAITAAEDGTGTVVTQTDSTFEITGGTQAGSNLFHSFEQLGLDANQIANILSNSDITNILGRVVGGDASVINGLLQVTGGNSNLFLINPAGIVFGPDAQVITPGSFAASSADAIQIGDDWFNALGTNNYGDLVGEPSGYAFAGGEAGAVLNAGSISSAGESVTLLGGVVVNTGTIETPGGTINIAAVPGENLVSITQGGNLLSIALPTEARSGLNGASQGLAAESISALLAGAGMAGELGVVVEDGVTKLVSMPISMNAGTAIASGTLDVSDASENGTGGEIDVLGERVALLNATLQASGTNGGGTVRVGGDYRGQGPVANAEQTYVDEGSTIAADALAAGNGGRVIVWAEDTTDFDGSVNARGGSASGDGGFVEVSGREDLLFAGSVDVSANGGNLGTLLLDPTNVTISSNDPILSAPGNVIVEATNNITITESIEFSPSGGSIRFTADSDNDRAGDFVMPESARLSTQGRDLSITGANIFAGEIATYFEPANFDPGADGGDVTLTSTSGDVIVSFIDTSTTTDVGAHNGGDVTVIANRLFRATGTTDGFGSVGGGGTEIDSTPSPFSIFTTGALSENDSLSTDENEAAQRFRGGSIKITHGGITFVTGAQVEVSESDALTITLLNPFEFSAGQSGTRGIIFSSNTNGKRRVYSADVGFINSPDISGIIEVSSRTGIDTGIDTESETTEYVSDGFECSSQQTDDFCEEQEDNDDETLLDVSAIVSPE